MSVSNQEPYSTEVDPTSANENTPIDKVFARVSDAQLTRGNRLKLLENGPETYDDWISAIEGARRWVHLENYIFKADEVGRRFARVLAAKAAEGVSVRVLFDWYGSMGVSPLFWRELRATGVDARMFNPFSPGAPLAAFLRDHRKLLAVDGEYASVGGVCIAKEWIERSPNTGLPYRDTAVTVAGPAVADLERAFAQVWDRSGTPLPAKERPEIGRIPSAGDQAARVVIQEPGKMRVARLLEVLTAGVRERLWISDAYFLAGPNLNQALMSASRDGVDVRLLLPASNDLPLVGTLSRAGYRQLLEAGVAIHEYGGLMRHAKTTVADGSWSRVGSTNLNITGLLTDWEIDLVAEDHAFATEMERMFEDDLADAREIKLGGTAHHSKPEPERPVEKSSRRAQQGFSGSGSRAVVTAVRAGGSALMGSGQALERHERTVAAAVSGSLLGASLLGVRFPRVLAWPLAVAGGLVGASGLVRALRPATRPVKSERSLDAG